MVRGCKKRTASKRRNGLPITPELLRDLKAAWEAHQDINNVKMIWAAACMCIFNFLRVGKAVVRSVASYDPEVHLNEADVSVDRRTKPSYIEVQIKTSKTDVFRRGVTVYLGTTGNDLCPVTAVLSYMTSIQRLPTTGCGPFFHFSSGQQLTRDSFVKEVQSALQLRGVEAAAYTGHSF